MLQKDVDLFSLKFLHRDLCVITNRSFDPVGLDNFPTCDSMRTKMSDYLVIEVIVKCFFRWFCYQ